MFIFDATEHVQFDCMNLQPDALYVNENRNKGAGFVVFNTLRVEKEHQTTSFAHIIINTSPENTGTYYEISLSHVNIVLCWFKDNRAHVLCKPSLQYVDTIRWTVQCNHWSKQFTQMWITCIASHQHDGLRFEHHYSKTRQKDWT